MSRVHFVVRGEGHVVSLAPRPYSGFGRPGSLLDVGLAAGLDIDHACGGQCSCTTCHVTVASGGERLSPMEEKERDRLQAVWDLTPASRLACQAVVHEGGGALVVEFPAKRDKDSGSPCRGGEDSETPPGVLKT